MAVEHEQEGGAVGRRGHGRLGADGARSPAAVLNHNRGFQLRLQARLNAACNLVGGAAGRKGNDDADGVDVQLWASLDATAQHIPQSPSIRPATARATMRITSPRRECLFCARSRERIFTIDLDGAGLDAWNKLAPELNSIVERIEAADEKGGRTKPVIFEDRFGHLLGGTHQT